MPKGILNPKNLISLSIAVLTIVVIAYLNFLLIRYHFLGEFNQNLSSIEISYIQMAKFTIEGGSLWQPLWYLGYPWHVFYTPLLPILEVLFHQLFNFSFAHAYRVLTGIGYVLVPLSLYLFVWQITKSKTGAIVSALMYSLAPSLISIIFSEVGADTLSGLLEPRRFTILVRWGEGPHTFALFFLPLFGLIHSRLVEISRLIDLLAASFFIGFAVLTNAIALWVAILISLAFLLSELGNKINDFTLIAKKFLALFVLSYGLIGFWYNFPFIKTFFQGSGEALNRWTALFPWGFIPLFIIFAAVVFLVNKFSKNYAGIAFGVFWFLVLFALVFIYYASGGDHVEYVPQALRLNTEVDMALSLLVGAIISNLFLWFWNKKGMVKVLTRTLALLAVILPSLALLLWGSRLLLGLPEYTKPLSQSKIGNIKNTAEYKVATKLAELTEGTSVRVFAPGNYGFWLDYFEAVPQLRGALYQSSTNSWPEHIYYQVTNGPDADISLAWLKIANVGKLVYTTIGSAEVYKDYKVPVEKFRAIGKEISTENGDIYFDIPLKNDLLAKVVDAGAMKGLKKPYNAIDEQPIFSYLAWLEQKADKRLKVEKISNSHWRISGEIADGEAVLFQQTYDSGWKVKQSGWKAVKDPLDFTLLVPKKSGRFEIEVVYTRPWVVYFGYLITLATVGWVVNKSYRSYKSYRSNS